MTVLESTLKKEKKSYSNLKHFAITLIVYILKVKTQNNLFLLKYNSGTSCQKGEYVYTTKFRYMIESSILIIQCNHTLISMFISRCSIGIKTMNMEIGD